MQSNIVPLVLLAFVVATLARPSIYEGKRLVQISEDDPGRWVSEDEIFALKGAKINFMDITERNLPKIQDLAKEDRIPKEILFHTATHNAFSHLSVNRSHIFIEHFTSYFNRFYSTETGNESALWLLEQVQSSIAESGYNGTASGETFSHSWLQPSIIARITGADPTLSSEIVILGAHLDSTSLLSTRAAPGADDNGSGSVALLEAFRGLLLSDFIPKRTIEFQWYAAEEVGLRGSGDIADTYSNEGVDVVSMMNFDVVGYNVGRNVIGIMTDYVNAKVNTFLQLIVDEYLDFGWESMTCGYACSDHASFYRAGFLTAFPSEIVVTPYIHTARDTIDTLNFEQIHEFSKLAVAYAVELSQPHITEA